MKYRLKRKIEAQQWFSGVTIEGVKESDEEVASLIMPDKEGIFDLAGWIETGSGKMAVRQGDYVITDEEGQKHCCCKEEFEKLFEKDLEIINE